MEPKKANRNTILPVLFDLKDMTTEEMKAMFMNVSVKSLGSWLEYYQGKEEYEICKLIKDISDYKNGKPGNVPIED